MASQNNIQLGIKLQPSSEVQSELNSLITQLEKDGNVNLKIDTKQVNQSLKEFGSILNNITSQMKNGFNFQGMFNGQASGIDNITNKLKLEQKAMEQTANTLKTLSSTNVSKISIVDGQQVQEDLKNITKLQDGIGKTTKITKDLKTGIDMASSTENFAKLENIVSNLQNKLNKSSSNKFIDASVFTELQNKLNGINTNTAESEIKALQQTINNLSSGDNQIVRLQNTISKMENNLTSMKGKYGSLVGDSSSRSELNSYISQVEKLKTTLASLKSGGNISGSKLSSELNLGVEASRNLSTAVKNSSSALKTAQQDASSFGNSLRKVFENAGLYMSAYQAIRLVSQSIKEGISTVIDMDTSLGNLNKVVSMSKEQLLQMRDSAVQMGKELGRSSIEIANSQAEFGRLYKTQDEINQMTKVSVMGANVMDGVSSADVAKSLTTIITSMKLEAKDSMTILDSMNEIQNNYRVSAKDLSEALAEVGSTAYTSGASLQQVEGYITSIAVATGESGSEVGTALRTIMSRVFKIGSEGIEAEGKPEKMLNDMGVAVRDSSGQFRDFSQIMGDLNTKWQTMTDTEKIGTAQVVAGVQRYNQFIALMNNYKTAISSTTTALNSQGSASKENEIHMSTASAKLGTLKASLEELAYKMINSDMVKSAIDGLTNLVNALSNVDGSTVALIATFSGLALALKSISSISGIFKGISSLGSIGKEVENVGALGKAFGGLGTSAGGALSSLKLLLANPWVMGGAVVIGGLVASYEEYQNVMSKPVLSTTTDDLSTFGKMVNSVTGNVIKSKQELIESNSAYEDFSDGLSDKFKDSVEDASKSFNKLKMTLAFDGTQIKFSDKMSQGIKDQVDKIVVSAKESIMDKRGELQDTFSQLFTIGDGKLDENESGVMTSISNYQSSKFETIQTLNQNIYDTLNKAVEDHRELTQKDIDNIENWTKQIQMFKIKAESQNEADNKYASNQGKFEKRLSSMTPEEALSESKNTYNEVINISQETEDKQNKLISDANAFKTELEGAYSEAIAKGDTNKANEIANDIKTIEQNVTTAQNSLNEQVEIRQKKTKDLWKAFYEVNPDKKGKINEITFSEFNGADIKSNKEFDEVMNWYPQVADVTETSMKRIKNANGSWSDVAITVDEATGKIVSIYDTTTGTVAGYSKQFEDDAEKTYSNLYNAQAKIVSLMNDTYSKTNGGSNFKLNNDDMFSIVDDKGVETTIKKMQQVIKLADGYKVAVANINGKQIKMEFDEKGALRNYEDVLSAINGDKNSKAIINIDVNDKEAVERLKQLEELKGKLSGNTNTKISIDGEGTSSITEAIDKLEQLPKDTTAKISINGEEVSTVDEAIKKLLEVPKETSTKISINGEEVSSVDDALKKFEEIKTSNPNATIEINGEQISTVEEADKKLRSIPTNTNTNINQSGADGVILKANDVETAIGRIPTQKEVIISLRQTFSQEAIDYGIQDGARFTAGHNAKGTDNWRGGLTWINEEGGELVNLPNGTQIIPHDLSEKIIEESANNTGNLTVNKIDIYQNKDNTSGQYYVNKSNTLNKAYVPEIDTDNMSDSEKKWYEDKKKAEDEAERKLKDRVDKEKKYLDDISDAWESKKDKITQSINEIELAESELGDNITGSQKMDILNQKYQKQLELLPQTQKQLNTYLNTTLTTSEGQEELSDKIQDATDALISQKKAVTEAYNELKKYQATLVEDLRDELAKNILKDAQDMLAQSKENDIKNVQNKLDSLDDERANNEEKLNRLKEERSRWLKDDSSIKDSKVKALDEMISETEKTIQRDNLQSQLDNLNDYYDEQEKMLTEEKAYADADKLLKEKNISAIEEIISSHAENFRKLGFLLGENFATALTEKITGATNALDSLLGKDVNIPNDPNSGGMKNVWINDGANTQIYTDPTGTDSKGSLWKNGISSSDKMQTEYEYENGFYKVYNTKGDEVGWIPREAVKEWHDVAPRKFDSNVWISDGANTQIYKDATGTTSKGSLWQNGIASEDKLQTDYEYNNGFFKIYDANGKEIGWIPREAVNKWNNIQSFDTGGMTPDNLGSTGGLAIVHSKERILDANNTQAFNSLVYDVLPRFTDNLSNIRNNYSNSTTNESKVEINNEFTISNNHQVQADNLPKNINQLMKQQLLSQGKRTI